MYSDFDIIRWKYRCTYYHVLYLRSINFEYAGTYLDLVNEYEVYGYLM